MREEGEIGRSEPVRARMRLIGVDAQSGGGDWRVKLDKRTPSCDFL